MITAFVLLDVHVDRVPEVAEELCGLDGVTEVYSVTGRIGKVTGIVGSETVIAFRSYPAEALDAGFALGQDPPT